MSNLQQDPGAASRYHLSQILPATPSSRRRRLIPFSLLRCTCTDRPFPPSSRAGTRFRALPLFMFLMDFTDATVLPLQSLPETSKTVTLTEQHTITVQHVQQPSPASTRPARPLPESFTLATEPKSAPTHVVEVIVDDVEELGEETQVHEVNGQRTVTVMRPVLRPTARPKRWLW